MPDAPTTSQRLSHFEEKAAARAEATLTTIVQRMSLIALVTQVVVNSANFLTMDLSVPGMMSSAIPTTLMGIAVLMAYQGMPRQALLLGLGGVMGGQVSGQFEYYIGYNGPQLPWMRIEIAIAIVGASAILLERKHFYAMAAFGAIPPLVGGLLQYTHAGIPLHNAAETAGIGGVLVVLIVLCSEFTRTMRIAREESSGQHMAELERVVGYTQRIAEGDLGFAIDEDMDGELVGQVKQLKDRLQTAFSAIGIAAHDVGAAAAQLQATAASQSSGATEQSAAVEETRATVASMAEQAQLIESHASANTDSSQSSADTSVSLAAGLEDLITNTQQMAGLLEEIRAISDKTELLALNASLEGVRAGEAGRGFTLVAAQMQQLAESVQSIVGRLHALNNNVADATERTRSAMEETTASAVEVAGKAAQVREHAGRQQQGMVQVDRSIGEIADVAARAAEGSAQLSASASQLVGLVSQIEATVSEFTGR